jgi:hypothetical protein
LSPACCGKFQAAVHVQQVLVVSFLYGAAGEQHCSAQCSAANRMHSTLAVKQHVHPHLNWCGNSFVFCGVLVGACCRNAQPGSSTAWPVVLLPRGEGSGLSGGWRGFAIDQVRYTHEFDVMTYVSLISTMFL